MITFVSKIQNQKFYHEHVIFERQFICLSILLASLVTVATYALYPENRFKSESYLSLSKNSKNTDTSTLVLTGFNFGFETVSNPDELPDGWIRWGISSYNIQVDSEVKRSGNYSLRIEPKDQATAESFSCPALSISAIYEGKNITLKAFMRTEGVQNPIELLLRIDGNSGSLKFDKYDTKGSHGKRKLGRIFSNFAPARRSESNFYRRNAFLKGQTLDRRHPTAD